MNRRVAIRKENGDYLFGQGIQDELLIHSLDDLIKLHEFLQKHAMENVFFLLSYELGCELLGTTKLESKKRPQEPLAKFWVADKVSVNEDWVRNFQSSPENSAGQFNWKFGSTKAEYIESVHRIQKHIHYGDCYELNFCQRIEARTESTINGLDLFKHVREITNAPHSAYLEDDSMLIACGSPERFIKKSGNRLISQPIKGTAPRGKNEEEDREVVESLVTSEKDFVENVMIVDLVRNDCAKVATKGSVKVDELSELYTFETVHQLVSTISCDLKSGVTFKEILEALYPMGSMTGAPKKSAVQLSENYETHARNWYSGSMGYISPNGDFDCNVLIRTVFHDKQKGELSCMVGGAITHLSDPELEWEECKTKVGKIVDRFGGCQW